MKTTDLVDNQFKRTDIPKMGPGDEVKVHVRVVEGGKERIQVFQIVKLEGYGLGGNSSNKRCSSFVIPPRNSTKSGRFARVR